MGFRANCKPLNAVNEQRLMQLLDVVRATDRGDARSTRAVLFKVKASTTAFAVPSAERFEVVRAILDLGTVRPRAALS